LHTELYYRDERRNKNNDTSLFYVPHERFLQAGAGYSNLIALYFRHTSQEDLLPVPQYNRREDAAQVRLGYSLLDVSLYSNLDFGSAKDILQNKSFPFQRYALFAGFSPGSAQNYSVSWEYSSENNLYSGEKQDRISMSLGASLFIANTTNIFASVYWSRTFGSTRQEFGLVEAAMRHEFPNHHQISVQARQSSFAPAVRTRELAYQLQYSIPVSIPLKRLSANGQLRGRVIGEGRKGMENVLVNVGSAAAITDSDGDFFLPSLPPGRHYLIVDKASIGLERVTLQPMPMEIAIQGGEERRLIINVVKGSAIRAHVIFNTFVDTDTGEVVREMGPHKGVLIEAHNGTELHRRVSDARGNVLFAELKPGRWTVRVVGGEVPLYHALEQESYELSVAGGEQKTVGFSIMPRKRTIRIIHTEDVPVVQSQEKPREPAGPCLITYDERRRGYILQVSSWATRGKASERVRVAENVTGRKAWVERTSVPDLGIRYRVKVGLFSSITEAELYCRKLQKLEMEPAHD
ncbi:MAG TPA: SPOR domain-containing protein, partial [Bacteroidota bacterium]